MNFKKTFFLLSTALVLSTPAVADTEIDETPIVIGGTVSNLADNEFILNYRNGNNTSADNQIRVELDGWKALFNDFEESLQPGQNVIVAGEIDDDLFEGREIEADSVYLVDQRRFYANQANNNMPLYYIYATPANQQGTAGTSANATQNIAAKNADGSNASDRLDGWVNLTGTVKSLKDQEFTMDTGSTMMQVDIERLGEYPLDVDMGDRVSVTGYMDDGFFEGREIMADNVVILQEK